MKKRETRVQIHTLMALLLCGAGLIALPRAAFGGYWKQGTPEITERHTSASQYGHEFKIASFGTDHVSFNYRDGLSGNRTLLDCSWTVPGLIVPGEIIPASVSYNVQGPKIGGFLMRFDVLAGTTDAGSDLIGFTLGQGSPGSGKLANTKNKAPFQGGERAIHISAGLTGGLTFKVRIPYLWVEGDAPRQSAAPVSGSPLLDELDTFFESLVGGVLPADDAARTLGMLKSKASEALRSQGISKIFFERYARMLETIRLVFATRPDDPQAADVETKIGRFVRDLLGRPWDADMPVSKKIGTFSDAVAQEIAALRRSLLAQSHRAGPGLVPLKAGEAVPAPRILKEVKPTYPPVALSARVAGVVILDVLIDVQGNVRDIKIIRSIPLLDQAAVAAVKQWKYEPTVVEGQLREVIKTEFITFTIE